MIGSWLMVPLATAISVPTGGTCRCDNGCHHFAGQCVHQNDCAPGYVPSCPVRDSDDHVCPHDNDVSCDGTCTCIPAPASDAGVGEAGGSDGGGAGDGASYDGDGTADASAGGDAGVDGGGVDGASYDGASSDAASEADGGSPGPGTACDCPVGYRCEGSDVFCAGPCGGGGTCSPGYDCTGGDHCVPDCLVHPCAAPLECDYGSGQCVSPPGGDAGADAGPSDASCYAEGGGHAGKDDGGEAPWNPGLVLNEGGGAGGDRSGLDDSGGDGRAGDDRGCACNAVGDCATGGLAVGLSASLGLGLVLRRRRAQR